ncbi:MAG: 50S ribosomal protein L19 [Patescibacteria group bacterium]
MQSVIDKINAKYKKPHVVDVKSGDTVRVHQKIKEGNKERIQVFEGLVIRTSRTKSHTSSITVRKVASGVGVEKTYLVHSPLVVKLEVTKRSKVRRNYLSYIRARSGKSARLSGVDFDRAGVNAIPEVKEDKKEEAKPEEAQEEQKESQKPEEVEDKIEEKTDKAEEQSTESKDTEEKTGK